MSAGPPARRRGRPDPQLERQGRISLCRSRQQQLCHHRHVERLQLRHVSRRRELPLLRTRTLQKNTWTSSLPAASPAAGIFLRSCFAERYDETTRLTALGPLPFLSGSTSKRDALSLGEVLQSRALHRRDVNEHVAAAIIRLDEAIAALTIEKLDGPSHGHREILPRTAFAETRYARVRPTGHSLPESMATLTAAAIGGALVPC